MLQGSLKRAFADGTVAVDMDALSLCAASRPASRRRAFTPSSTLACSPRRVAHVGAQAHRTAPCEATSPASSPRSASRPTSQHALPASTRRPPYWKSTVLRRKAPGDAA
ncbi:uncharacterized protein SOCE26_001830 [Sorangium cellulosum]|uniref:Uncharacterized protein n=1 Tax=Sorangium cellulosum TaxID=56 RepID=A0A2L0EHM7_SORCE|nr:uncharacterized protein SOCE26_001830 [Sorangium cellulosum]